MLRHLLITALRSLRKQRMYTLINVLGLAAGMAGFGLFAANTGVKLNSDRFHEGADRIFAMVQVEDSENKEEVRTAYTPAPLIPAMRSEFAEVEAAVRVMPAGRVVLARGSDGFFEGGMLFVDSNFLSFFAFDMASGDRARALADPYSIVLSEKTAAKYFGKENPIGQVLTLENKVRLTVTGVTGNLPRTSSLTFDMLVPIEAARSLSDSIDRWDARPCGGFVRLGRASDRAGLEAKLPAFLKKHFPLSAKPPKSLHLFPLLNIRLGGSDIDSFWHSSNRTAVAISLGVGLLLLVVVSINFVSLTTARHLHRTKEIGLRKTLGAARFQIAAQLMGESVLLALLALPLAAVIYELVHPIVYSGLIGETSVSNSIWNYPFLLKYLVLAAVLTGLLSGLYPSIALSAYRPAHVLRGGAPPGRIRRRGQRFMIVLQFTLATVMIMAAGVLDEQADRLVRADLGYSRDDVAFIEMTGDVRAGRERLRAELSRLPGVMSVSFSADLPGLWSSPRPAVLPGMKADQAVTVESYAVDTGFPETLGMKMLQGRSFAEGQGDASSFVISETAARRLGLDDPVGKELKVGDRNGTVIGVARDFLFADIGFEVPPAVLYVDPESARYLLVKFPAGAGFPPVREALKRVWLEQAPNVPFECRTIGDKFRDMTRLVDGIVGLFRLIGLTAVFFSCLGLLGLASYLLERRTKEIGIRKALGASVRRVAWEIGREFVLLVAIADVLALAIMSYAWSKVLETGLLYLTGISFGTYAAAVFATLATAGTAVALRTYHAARANPIESLRYE